jgi:hypothetical protein
MVIACGCREEAGKSKFSTIRRWIIGFTEVTGWNRQVDQLLEMESDLPSLWTWTVEDVGMRRKRK